MYLEKMKTNSKGYMHPYVHSGTIYNSQDMEANYMSINRWMDKKDVVWVHTHTHIYTLAYYSVIKKNEILPFAATWMDLKGFKLSEISQIEKDKYCMISLICGI